MTTKRNNSKSTPDIHEDDGVFLPLDETVADILHHILRDEGVTLSDWLSIQCLRRLGVSYRTVKDKLGTTRILTKEAGNNSVRLPRISEDLGYPVFFDRRIAQRVIDHCIKRRERVIDWLSMTALLAVAVPLEPRTKQPRRKRRTREFTTQQIRMASLAAEILDTTTT